MRSEFVIVGGGAGGLELACKLGRKLGPSKVALVDSRLYHIWKPSLHEVAAGTLDVHQEGLSYQMLAHDNGFTFVYGAMTGLDADARSLTIAPVTTGEGEEVLPERTVNYRSVVLSVGSVSNYFGVPGAREHTISLNAVENAERFRLTLLKLLARAEYRHDGKTAAGIDVVIIGGGATGVELAAELREASGVYATYGIGHEALRDVRITLLEGAPRILAPLPEKVSAAALRLLDKRSIRVVTSCRVTGVAAGSVSDKDGHVYPADLCVWAAGIRAPELLAELGLPVAKGGQVIVDERLQVTGAPGVYALGDCAECKDAKGAHVPPRAQAAHQQADYLLETFLRETAGKSNTQAGGYVYKDYGSLVSMGQTTSVGSLMGSLKGMSWFVEGFVARMMYVSLHLLHHKAVLGAVRTGVLAVARFLIKRTTPLVKLH